MTPAGLAVCPHTATRPENDAGRAGCGAEIGVRSLDSSRKSMKRGPLYQNDRFFSILLTSKMSHDGIWRAACKNRFNTLLFQFHHS